MDVRKGGRPHEKPNLKDKAKTENRRSLYAGIRQWVIHHQPVQQYPISPYFETPNKGIMENMNIVYRPKADCHLSFELVAQP